MKIRSVNRLLLISVLLTLVLGTLNSVLQLMPQQTIDLVEKVVVIALLLLMARKDGTPILEVLPFRRTPWKVLALTLLFYVVSWPLVTLFNVITLLFATSITSTASEIFEEPSLLQQVITVAMIPAFYEECLIRGAVLQGYRKTGRVRAAILMSALIFGLFHANIAQFFYTTVMGLCLALIVEASGSLWTGILFHFVNNSSGIILMSLLTSLSSGSSDSGEGGGTLPEFLATHIPFVAGFVAVTVVGILLFRPILRLVRKFAGREEAAVEVTAETTSFRTPALIIFIVLSVAMIAATLPMFLR